MIGSDPPRRLDKALARDVPAEAHLSRSRLARLLEDGAVSLGGQIVADARASVSEGDIYQIEVPQSQEVDTSAEAIPLDIVFEDGDLSVVNKAAGMVVHPAPGSPGGTLVNALLHHFGDALSGVGGEKRPGIVHRIDKDTSGLLVVAKTDRAHHGLAAQFEAHTAEREYIAFCHGTPDQGDPRLRGIRGVSMEPGAIIKVTTGLARHKTDRQRQAVLFQGGRHAVSRFRVDETYQGVAARLTCRLETGRTHQIRVHAAHIGHGLVGDPVYGGRRKGAARKLSAASFETLSAFDRQALHAATLGIVHPATGEKLHFEAPLPDDLIALQAALRS